MRRRILSIILSLSMILSAGLYFKTSQVRADDTLARYVMGAEALPDGKIAVLFIKGGSTKPMENNTFHVVDGGTLYYMVYNPQDNSWVEEPVGESAPAASEAALTISNGVPHVVYVDNQKDIAYTYKTASGWSSPEMIDSINADDKQGELFKPDIALDDNGVVYVSYMDTHGAADDRYVLPDVMCASNASGAFIGHVIQSCTGWFDSPDGGRETCKDPFMALNDKGFVISYWYAYWEKSAWGQDTGYHALISTSNTQYDFCDDWRNLTIYGALGKGNDSWAFVYNKYEGNYKIVRPYNTSDGYAIATDVALEHSEFPAAVTMDDLGHFYFAGVSENSAVFFQNGTTTDVTTTNARYNSFNRVFTILSGGDQYLLYTGNDEDRSLIVAKFDGADLDEYKVPNIMPEPTPEAVFTATGIDSGKLTNVASGMKYSLDGGETWIGITSDTVDIDSGITVDKGIKVYQPATSAITSDSEKQVIVVTKADTPALVPVQPSVIDGKGSIPTTTAYEYSTDGTTYTACTGELTDLIPGTYYVRAVASGTALTSDPQTITIVAFVPEQEATPAAVFEATGTESGELSNVSSGMKYSIDGGSSWVDIADTSVAIDSGISVEKGIQVFMPGNGETTIDSNIQTIAVTKAEVPAVEITQPSVIDGKGSVATTDAHEYSVDGISYTACTGATELDPGTYYIRVVASGTVLASDPQEITIEAFVPDQEQTPAAVFEAIGEESGVLSNVSSGMKYSIDGTNWIGISDTSVTIDSGLSVENGIKVYMPGNGTTTIDSDVQTIAVAKAEIPEVEVTQPSVIDGKGSVATTDAHEYSVDGISYTACTGATELDPGTYYVRVAASGNVLASDTQEITIDAFVPTKEDTPEAVLTKIGNETWELSNVSEGMKYSIDGNVWNEISGSNVVTIFGIDTGSIVKVIKPGNGTTTIDSDIQVIEAPLYHKVTINTRGGNDISPQYVLDGQKAAEPEDPTREGMRFNGWFWDEELKNDWYFSNPIIQDITLYADWYADMGLGVYNKSNPDKNQFGAVDIDFSREELEGYKDATTNNFLALDGTVTFTAKPAEGYKFVGWYEGEFGESSFVERPTDILLSDEEIYTCEASGIGICAVFECAGHQWETKINKATFDEAGSISQVCTVCGTEETVAPLLKVSKVSLEGTSFEYTGKAITPKVTVANDSEDLSSDCYSVEYKNNVAVGTATVTVTLKGDYYEGTKTLTFTIKEVPATPTPTKVPTATPTKAPTATPTAKPTKAPTATPTAKPTKAPTATPKPAKNSIKRAKVSFQYGEYEYRGDQDLIRPAINVTLDGKNLKGKTDFKGELKNNDRPGTASITLTGQGKYIDSVTVPFNIVATVTCGKTLDLSKIKDWKGATFTLSDKTVASVDKTGKITGKQAGSASVTVKLKSGKTETFSLKVLYKDVTNIDDFWYAPTNALTGMGIVKGYDKQTNFKPANECSRAQMVTFLWRLAGEPKPKSKTTAFKDVKSSDYFFKPVIWAVEKGITTGVSKTKFDPQGICTRAQTVTFLWRMAGKPAPKAKTSKFSDVKSSDYFYKATIWASEKSIVAGYSDGTFKPQGKCLRRQMVTFLYKYYNNVGVKK